MKSLQFYIEAFWRSLFDIGWLRERRKDGGRASKYFLGLMLIISLLYAFALSRAFVTEMRAITEKLAVVAPELALEKKEGKFVASGIDEPFLFEMEREDAHIVFFIDTTTSSDALSIPAVRDAQEQAIVIAVTQDRIDFIGGKRIGQEDFSLPVEDVKEGQSIANGKKISHIRDFAASGRFFAIVFSVSSAVLFIVLTLIQLILLAIVAGITTLAARAKNSQWTFGELFTVSLFAMTLPLLLGDVLSLAGIQLPFVPTIVFLVLLFAVVFYKDQEKVPDQHLDK